jgi:outer membrane protein TolC
MKQTPIMRPVFFLLAFAALVSVTTSAQVIMPNNGNKKVLDSTARERLIQEKLVELALKGPLYRGTEHQNKINQYQLRAAQNSWLNLLSLSANFNDQTLAHINQSGTNTYVYPKYFFGVNVPLGTLFSRTAVKSARESIEISKDNQEELARTIRADVLLKYRQYLVNIELINMESELINDVLAAFSQAELKFKNGNIPLDSYISLSKEKNDERGKFLGLQLQQYQVKLDLEKMIGTNLESVLALK